MTSQTTVRIRPLTGAFDELHLQYPREFKPQPCYIELDIQTGNLTAEVNGVVGGAVPFPVWHGIVRRYRIPALSADNANVLLEDVAPLAQRVLDGATIEWDGNNHVGRLTEDAQDAEIDIEMLIDRIEPEAHLQVWDVADWLGQNGDRELGISVASTPEELAALAAEIESDAAADGIVLNGDIEEYLTERVAELQPYEVTCTAAGQAQMSAEYLGEAFGRTYPTEEEAEEVADELRDNVEDFGLHPTTEYRVERVRR
jgi:hypothetical protein